LDEIPGVAASRVDWTGKRFLIELAPRADAPRVARDSARALGQGATVLDAEGTRAAVDAFRAGEAWMRAGETLRLSHHEAQALASRYGTEAASALDLDAETTRQLIELFERELERAFERTHANRGDSSVTDELEAAGRRILEGSRRFLDERRQQTLEGFLENFARPRSN
jgi:hypothetical protein